MAAFPVHLHVLLLFTLKLVHPNKRFQPVRIRVISKFRENLKKNVKFVWSSLNLAEIKYTWILECSPNSICFAFNQIWKLQNDEWPFILENFPDYYLSKFFQGHYKARSMTASFVWTMCHLVSFPETVLQSGYHHFLQLPSALILSPIATWLLQSCIMHKNVKAFFNSIFFFQTPVRREETSL